jgi:glucokinase
VTGRVTEDVRSDETWLVGDIGATNARFGLVSPERKLLHTHTFPIDEQRTIAGAIDAFLGGCGTLPKPRQGAIAIASAIADDRVAMTNHPWSFSIAALRERLGLDRLEVINDFTAVALSLPHLGPDDRAAIGGGQAVEDAPIGVLGPGSGLGVSGLLTGRSGRIALAGEGGHATMAAATERESTVLDRLRQQFDHVSAERVLSGPGLVNLYNGLAALDGVPSRGYTPAQITDPATGAADPLCAEATAMFCAMLGTVAGDLALTLGARGGVYIAGGIVPRLGARFAASPFRQRFEAKGRFSAYLAAIPTHVVTQRFAAFLGCAALLAD